MLAVVLTLCCLEAVRGVPWTRWLWREAMQALVRLDLAAVALIRWAWPPRYEVVGACQRRGACCTQIVAHPPRFIWQRPRLKQAFVAFHRVAHNFHQVGEGPNHELVFRCHFLTAGGRCGIYRYRPRLCRTYPLLPFFAPPKVLPGCGYRIKRRGLGHSAKLPIVEPHVGMHHPTPPTRVADSALEHAEDYRLVALTSEVRTRESATESRCR